MEIKIRDQDTQCPPLASICTYIGGHLHSARTHTGEYGYGILTEAIIQINLQNCMLSEKSQAQMVTYYKIPFMRNIYSWAEAQL